MTYHILNGDALADRLAHTAISQNFIICREALIEGNLKGETLKDFFTNRAAFFAERYHTTQEKYIELVAEELDQLRKIPEDGEICLWFGNDLFCQANMWFVIDLLAENQTLKLFRVFPNGTDTFGSCKGFAESTEQMLEKAYLTRKLFKERDIKLGRELGRPIETKI